MNRILWPLLLAGCTRTTLIQVELPEDGIYLLLLDNETGGLSRVERPFLIEDGRLTAGERPQVELTDELVSGRLLRIDVLDLENVLLESFDALDAELAEPPPAPVLILAGDLFVEERGLPEDVELFDVTEAGLVETPVDGNLRAAITLTVPVDPEPCDSPYAAFMPFTSERETLGNFKMNNRFGRRLLDVAWVDAQHAIGMADEGLMYFTRNETWSRGGGGHLEINAPTLELATAFDIDPTSTWLVVATRTSSQLPARGSLLQVEVTPSGLPAFSTVTATNTRLKGAAIRSDGTAYAIGDDGVVLERPPGVPVRTLPPFLGREAWNLVVNDDEVIAATTSEIFRYDGSAWIQAPLGYVESVHWFGLAEGGDEIWAGGSDGELVRYDGTWQRLTLELPPRLAACAALSPGGVRPMLNLSISSIGLDATHAYLGLETCNVVLAVDRTDLCTAVMPFDAEVEITDDFPTSIDVGPNGLLVGTHEGRLYVAERR